MMGFVSILIITLGAAPSAVSSQPVGGRATQTDPSTSRVENSPSELLVRFRSWVPASEQAKIHKQAGASVVRSLLLPRAKLVRLHGKQSLGSAIEKYESHSQVEYAEPNSTAELAGVIPNDTYFTNLWGLNNTGQTVNGVAGTPGADVDAPEAWSTTTGSPSVTVGIADTGVDYNNPDLSPNVVPGHDFVGNDTDPLDDVWHGTFVAGIIGAVGNNNYGVSGVDWQVGLAPLKMCSLAAISGSVPPVHCTAADQADAFTYAGNRGMVVVNASFNQRTFSKTVYNAIKGAPNTLFVAAAGNQGSNLDTSLQYPCGYDLPNVICVGATDQRDTLASYSNYGASSVDLAAPGSNIWGIYPFVSDFSETFDTDLSGRWITGGANNTWARVCSRGSCFLQDSPRSNYLNNTDSWAQAATAASTVGGNHCQLQYRLKGKVASGDELRTQVSSNGSTWTQVTGWSGSLTGWKTATYPLSGFDGNDSVYIRFELISGESGTADGVSIDNVKLSCLRDPGTYQDNEYAFSQGTSFATAYVSGAAALLEAQDPAATVADIKNAILDGVDPQTTLSGKTVTGGRLNVQRSLALVGR